jgi:stress response protein YsnF
MTERELYDRCCGQAPTLTVTDTTMCAQCMSCGETVEIAMDNNKLMFIEWNKHVRTAAKRISADLARGLAMIEKKGGDSSGI